MRFATHRLHLPAGISLDDAARVELQHFIRLVDDSPLRRLPDAWTGWGDVDAARLDAIVAHSRDAAIVHTPTLSMQANLLHMRRPVGEVDAHHRLLPACSASSSGPEPTASPSCAT